MIYDMSKKKLPILPPDEVTEIVDVEENWEEIIEAEPADYVRGSGYTSPVMAKMSATRLSVVMLNEEIPKIRTGEEAAARLAKATRRLSDPTRHELMRKVTEGDAAKERLFAAALPLIRTVASREYRRRQQWGSQVTLEDLTQETIIGFLKGIAGFRTDAIGRSATNYLGQWMLVETRRAAEVLDHDLQVGHDAGERFRRVRALRTRLAQDLGREPTDEEISDASRNPDYVTKPGMVGRAPKEINPDDTQRTDTQQSGTQGTTETVEPTQTKGITPAQVAEERAMRSRVGHMARFSQADDTDESSTGPGLVDPNRENFVTPDPHSSLYTNPEDQIIDTNTSEVIAAVLNSAMTRLGLPEAQREIIARRYGLPPYEESSAREIARVMRLQRDRVSRVLTAFQQEMTRPGGALHAVIKDMDPDDLRTVGLAWAVDTLGDWPKEPPKPPANILIDSITLERRTRPTATGEEKTKAAGVLAWFQCDYHDRIFTGLYQTRAQVPKRRACPSCQRPSERIKIATT